MGLPCRLPAPARGCPRAGGHVTPRWAQLQRHRVPIGIHPRRCRSCRLRGATPPRARRAGLRGGVDAAQARGEASKPAAVRDRLCLAPMASSSCADTPTVACGAPRASAQASLPLGGVAPGWRVGIPAAKTNASKAPIAKTASEARSPSSRDCWFCSTIASAVSGWHPCFLECYAQVGVGDERNAASQFDLRG